MAPKRKSSGPPAPATASGKMRTGRTFPVTFSMAKFIAGGGLANGRMVSRNQMYEKMKALDAQEGRTGHYTRNAVFRKAVELCKGQLHDDGLPALRSIEGPEGSGLCMVRGFALADQHDEAAEQ